MLSLVIERLQSELVKKLYSKRRNLRKSGNKAFLEKS